MIDDVLKGEGCVPCKYGSTAVGALLGDSGPVRCRERVVQSRMLLGQETPCLGQGNLGTQIWTPCDSPRHNTTASSGLKYE